MIAIRAEIQAVADGTPTRRTTSSRTRRTPPKTARATEWTHPYSREDAAFPVPELRHHKYWPPVSRVDNPFGDRNLVCACPPIEAYQEG
jgi:glycine dehydrogenase